VCSSDLGRGGHVVEMRAKQLGIHEPVLNRIDKERAFEEILARQKLDASEIAYVGDDLLDLPVLRRVGFSATVADGAKEVRDAVHFTTRACGGFGAVREVIELLLQQKGLWDAIVQRGGLG
jgi:3-deoxy-D-manno-octulosonate 8-phosphate phosphatase (KDO 8-P phosphatase)